jgi:hypothetical protein
MPVFLFEPARSKVPASGGILGNVNVGCRSRRRKYAQPQGVTPFTTYRSSVRRPID